MLPVVWTAAASDDLMEIIDYITARDPIAASRLWEKLERSVANLSAHPYLFKESDRMPGYREVVAHPNYLIFYRVLGARMQIEMVAHSRRLYPLRRENVNG